MKDVLFHLAFPTHDVAAAKRFYVEGLGCTLGRESSHAVMFGLAGHQLVAHLTPGSPPSQPGIYPRHFGLVLPSQEAWQALVDQAVPWHPHRTPHIFPRRSLPEPARIQTLHA
jgi:uncharacterized protein